jgi:hypothetical protein
LGARLTLVGAAVVEDAPRDPATVPLPALLGLCAPPAAPPPPPPPDPPPPARPVPLPADVDDGDGDPDGDDVVVPALGLDPVDAAPPVAVLPVAVLPEKLMICADAGIAATSASSAIRGRLQRTISSGATLTAMSRSLLSSSLRSR